MEMKNLVTMKCQLTIIALLIMLLCPTSGLSQTIHLTVAETFAKEHPATSFYINKSNRIVRVYGKAFAHGSTAMKSAEEFLHTWAGIWGCNKNDLIPKGPWGNEQHVQPMMYDSQTGTYRFTCIGYTQTVSGIPVYGTRLTVLVRNEPNFPSVLVSANLHDLGDWNLPDTKPDKSLIAPAVSRILDRSHALSKPRVVVFAGLDEIATPPRLAFVTEATLGKKSDGTYEKWLYIIDALDGSVLYIENRILHDIPGNVTAMATQSSGADECEVEDIEPLAYALISGSEASTYADADGNFNFPNNGSNDVILTSEIRGIWFTVHNQANQDSSISEIVPSDGAVKFVHNEENVDELYRSEVNAYIESNVVRDFTLEIHPDYPTIGSQKEWPVNVNIDSSCNAFYDYESINFFRRSDSCNNTAFSMVVHHEYGHHLVSVGGSGQGEYGEGMADTMAVLITGDNHISRGFYIGDCESGIRNADNDCQYLEDSCSSCGGQIHACGQLLSGCIWDIREQLMNKYPNGNEIISNLAINSILLHFGRQIDGAIPIDFLVLDDDDDNLLNGTPHADEIVYGFNSHGLPTPLINYLQFDLVGGLPPMFNPSGGDELMLSITNGLAEFQPETAYIYFHTGNLVFVQSQMNDLGNNLFSFTTPPIPCGNTASFWFSARTTDNQNVFYPLPPSMGQYFNVDTSCDSYCISDLNNDSLVDITDLLQVIAQWGSANTPADVNQDGIVDVSDLLIVVGNWGPCE